MATNNNRLSWVCGNDVNLCVYLYETVPVDGEPTRREKAQRQAKICIAALFAYRIIGI